MLKEEFTGLPSDGYEHNIGTFTLIPPGDSPPLNNSGELVELNHIYNDLFQGIEEDTMDIATKEKVVYLPVTMDMAPEEKAVFIPISPRGKPERTIYPGIYNFQVEISSSDTHKRKYLYSSLLNRIYVQMKTEFLVTYRWAHDGLLPPSPLYVRSCVVFSDDSQAEKRVERCTQHTHDDTTNVGLSQEIVKNVLHSAREKGTHGVYYCGKAEEADYWLSVVVELPVAARGSFGHAYQFVCKNSCPNGINRRAIDIIFTLEDANGTVYGRQTVGARCCACPPRDIKHDEKAEAETRGKRRVTSHEPAPHHPPGKKPKLDVKLEAADDVILTLPPMQVIGVKAAVTGLEVMASMMEQAAEFKRNDENYKKCIANIRSQIDKLKKP